MLDLRVHRPRCTHAGAAALAFTLCLTSGCGDESSPDGGVPWEGGGAPTLDSGLPLTDSAVPTNDSGLPLTDSGVPVGDSGQPQADGGIPVKEPANIPTQTDATTGNAALDAMLGDYLVKFHTVTRADNPPLGQVTTDSVSYGVLRVVADGSNLVGVERICHNRTTQDAQSGTVQTTVSDNVWPNLTPVRRELVVDTAAGTWSSPGAQRRQGWKSTAAQLPTDPVAQRADFLDPDADGRVGVTTRVTGQVFIVTADCEYDLVSYATTSYAGSLSAGGLLADAQITALESQAYALTATKKSGSTECTVANINEGPAQTTDVDELVLSRVDGQWLATPDACPALTEFQSTLP